MTELAIYLWSHLNVWILLKSIDFKKEKKTVAGGHNNRTPIPRLLEKTTIGIWIANFYLVKSYTLEME